MKKLIILLASTFLLVSCAETIALLGPASGVSNGNIVNSSLKSAVSYGVKKKIEPNKQLLIICKAGGRSMMAAQLLSQKEIKCINISDGFEGNGESPGWKSENLPSK